MTWTESSDIEDLRNRIVNDPDIDSSLKNVLTDIVEILGDLRYDAASAEESIHNHYQEGH